MTSFTRTWNTAYEAIPAQSEQARQGAERIRQMKVDVRERLEVDHSWAGDTSDGMHKKVTMRPSAANPAVDATNGTVFGKLVGTILELFYMSTNGNVTQLSSSTSPNANIIIPGTILPYGVSGAISPTTGYLTCNGAAVSRTTYSALFAAIATTWGVGDGATTFNVPDLRGRALIGDGTGTGLSARSAGQTMGTERHVLVNNELPNPSLSIPVLTGSIGAAGSTAAQSVNATDGNYLIVNAGGGQGHQNMQPSAVIQWVIKY